jgi:hypothetical protein
MKPEIDLLIIPLNQTGTKIIADLDLTKIANSTNIYCCSLNLVCKLLQHDDYPIKSKRIAITNILNFLKLVDTKIDILGRSDGKCKTCLPIGRDVLESYFSREKYKQYLTLLKELEVMSVVSYKDKQYYQIGKRSNLFRLHNTYVSDDAAICVTGNNIYSSLSIEGKHSPKLINTVKSIEVSYHSAIVAEINHYKQMNIDMNQLKIRLSKLFSLNGPRFIKYGKKVNRVFHSLSNLSKISREYLHINGAKFNNIDIVNCQPLLLCYYLLKNNLPVDAVYITDCETGRLYEQFYTKTGNDESDKAVRKEVKRQLYKAIFFDFKPANLLNKQFARLYPLTHQSLAQIALKEETLAAILQNTEAEIFNNLEPESSKYYFTLFDAIYFTSLNDLAPLRNQIKTKFRDLGLNALLTINGNGEDEYIFE